MKKKSKRIKLSYLRKKHALLYINDNGVLFCKGIVYENMKLFERRMNTLCFAAKRTLLKKWGKLK